MCYLAPNIENALCVALTGCQGVFLAWGKLLASRADNGPEYNGAAFLAWGEKAGIAMTYIQPGKPQQSTYVERYNRNVRTEWLGGYHFETIEEVRDHASRWLWTYDHERANMDIGS